MISSITESEVACIVVHQYERGALIGRVCSKSRCCVPNSISSLDRCYAYPRAPYGLVKFVEMLCSP